MGHVSEGLMFEVVEESNETGEYCEFRRAARSIRKTACWEDGLRLVS